MAVITPTITTNDPHEYREQMERIATFAEGVHIDFADGQFAPTTLLALDQAWRSDDLITHAHIMYQNPLEHIEEIMHLEADMVILHLEADDIAECLEILQEHGTRTGIALLPETNVSELKEMAIDELFDHVLLFGGSLGHQGGKADLSVIKKVQKLRNDYPDIEIGWDGGVNEENIAEIVNAGVDIVNVGSYLKQAEDPKKAYAKLRSLLS
jgi:ribulose-phosphate 3-epimerase